jgi:hypothetical protein
MTLLGESVCVRRRFAPTVYVEGLPVVGAYTDTPLVGSVQPLEEEDREVLPEGVRIEDTRKIYIEARGAVRTDSQHDQLKADEVLIDGERFTVFRVQSCHPLIPHTKAFLQRCQEGT